MKIYIYPYRKGSKSVKALKKALGVRVIKRENSRFIHRPNRVVLNWGASDRFNEGPVLNKAENIKKASNKLQAFNILSEGVSVPEYTTSRQEASQWLLEGDSVVCRTILNGHSGNGIIIAESEDQMVDAPLYVKYVKKTDEYRVHVFRDKAFFVQRKARRLEEENPNWKIRNHANGFIFANKEVEVDERAKEMSVKAVELLGLDFGAVDVIYNKKQDSFYVLEVNTAPGLTGTTLEKYVDVFKEAV